MQSVNDIFAIWGGTSATARAIGEKKDTVAKWRTRRRIPEWAWIKIIDAAVIKGIRLTANDLHKVNLAATQPVNPNIEDLSCP